MFSERVKILPWDFLLFILVKQAAETYHISFTGFDISELHRPGLAFEVWLYKGLPGCFYLTGWCHETALQFDFLLSTIG
jgi:hypothetical protein